MSKQPPSGTNPAEQSDANAPPRRRTPTYMEAVKQTPVVVAAKPPAEPSEPEPR